MRAMLFLLPALCLCLVLPAQCQDTLDQLDWLIGTWRAEHDGLTQWDTIPNMRYGETLVVAPAGVSQSAGGHRLLNFTAVSWAHSTKDHLHEEWGFVHARRGGNMTLMTNGNNGFVKYETGPWQHGWARLESTDIGRVSFTRDLPVFKLERTFQLTGSYLEQVLRMRTETHPKYAGTQEHTRILYTRVE